jgi:hypothetical protein
VVSPLVTRRPFDRGALKFRREGTRSSEFLYFYYDQSWWRVRIRDRKAERIGRAANFNPAGWGWFAIAPNDSLVVARSIGTGDIYALAWELP